MFKSTDITGLCANVKCSWRGHYFPNHCTLPPDKYLGKSCYVSTARRKIGQTVREVLSGAHKKLSRQEALDRLTTLQRLLESAFQEILELKKNLI